MQHEMQYKMEVRLEIGLIYNDKYQGTVPVYSQSDWWTCAQSSLFNLFIHTLLEKILYMFETNINNCMFHGNEAFQGWDTMMSDVR